ncbi:MAG: GtrA family protein [bacterium]
MKHILVQFKGNDNHTPFIQFVKYGISGGFSTLVHICLFYFMATRILPALNAHDVIASLLHLTVPEVSQGIRARNSMIDNTVAFLFSNLTAYIINITWVFSPGRHHPILEFLFFFGVSGIAILIGSTIMGLLIHTYGTTTTSAFMANILVSLMINFFIRKHIIFKD